MQDWTCPHHQVGLWSLQQARLDPTRPAPRLQGARFRQLCSQRGSLPSHHQQRDRRGLRLGNHTPSLPEAPRNHRLINLVESRPQSSLSLRAYRTRNSLGRQGCRCSVDFRRRAVIRGETEADMKAVSCRACLCRRCSRLWGNTECLTLPGRTRQAVREMSRKAAQQWSLLLHCPPQQQ